MKIIFGFLALLSFLAINQVAAKPLPVPGQELLTMNYLVNPGFENGTYGWTASGGATKTANATAKGEGNFGYEWDSNSAGQTLISASITVPPGLYGKNGIGFCKVKTPSGTATHTIVVDDGTNPLSATQTIVSSSTTFYRQSVNFIFPSSGSVRLKMTSVASNEPDIYIDNCMVGEAINILEVSQASYYGSLKYQGQANCRWDVTNNSAYTNDFPADTDCSSPSVTGSVTAPATKLPQFLMNAAPPGDYFVTANFYGWCQSATADYDTFELVDGSGTVLAENAYSHFITNSTTRDGRLLLTLVGKVTYQNAGDRSVKIKAKTSSASICSVEATGQNLEFNVVRYPLTADQAYRPDQVANSWSGYHGGNCSFPRASSSYGDPTADASCTLTERQNINFGTVTSYLSGSDKLPGIVFTPSIAGSYYVCAIPVVAGNTNGDVWQLELSDTNSQVVKEVNIDQNGVGWRYNPPLCGIYRASSAVSTTLRLRTKAGAGTITIGPADPTAASAVEWSIFQITGQTPAPLLVGSVTSDSTGVEHIGRAAITHTADATCAITSQSGSWLSSVSCSVTGKVTMNFKSGHFSAAPLCIVNNTNPTDLGAMNDSIVAPTTSSAEVWTFSRGAGALVNDPFNVICMGPK